MCPQWFFPPTHSPPRDGGGGSLLLGAEAEYVTDVYAHYGIITILCTVLGSDVAVVCESSSRDLLYRRRSI